MDDSRQEKFTPVAVFVYNRPEKTKTLFESLRQNTLAGSSEIFVFSDGPRDDRAKDKVDEVRAYIDSLISGSWFGNMTVYKSDTNKGLANSVISGVTDIINRYGKIIVLEDDLVLSPHFLTYMNECLKHYASDRRIWSVDGYSYDPVRPDGYPYNVYLTLRASSWGWGTWKDRWDMIDWDVRDYKRFRLNPIANILFSRGGNDLPSMLRAHIKGKNDSWAVRWCYSQFKAGMYSVVPLKTLVSNRGLDGTGTNCGDDDEKGFGRPEVEKDRKEWACEGITANRMLIRDFYKKHHLSIYIRIRDKLKSLGKG